MKPWRILLLALLLPFAARAQTARTVSSLNSASQVNLGDYVYGIQAAGGSNFVSVKMTPAQILAALNGETSVTTMAAGDYFVTLPAAGGNVNKLTTANLETQLLADGFLKTVPGGSVTQTGPTATTPTITDSGSTGSFTYVSGHQQATYVKTGRQVTFNLDIQWSAKTDNGSGSVIINAGLPGALIAGSGPQSIFGFGITTSAYLYAIVNGDGTISVYASGNTATDGALTGGSLGTAAGFRLTGSYISAS